MAVYHVRSTSLSSRSNPLFSQIEDEISSIRTWQSEQASCSTSLEAGLSRIEILHGALEDFLRLPQTQQCLHCCRSSFLDDFLCLVDVYGRFRDVLVTVQQIQPDAQATIRRKDTSKHKSQSKALRKVVKEILNLGSSIHYLTISTEKPTKVVDAADAELIRILSEVKIMMANVSATVLSSFAVTEVTSFLYGCSSWTSVLRRKSASHRQMAYEEMENKIIGLKELENCLAKLDNGSERVFKCLIKTRVSLLNALTL